jgi:hypothetical protein
LKFSSSLTVCAFFRKLKNKHAIHVHKAEVAQTGRAPDSIELIEGEAEDRVVAGSSPALGTTMLFWNKPATLLYCRPHLRVESKRMEFLDS